MSNGTRKNKQQTEKKGKGCDCCTRRWKKKPGKKEAEKYQEKLIVLTVLQLPPQREGRPPEEEEERAGGHQAPDELAVPHPLLAGVQDPAVLAAEGDLLDAPAWTRTRK